MAAFVDTQEVLLAWMAETLAGPFPAATVRPAGEAIVAKPSEPVAVLQLSDRGDTSGPLAYPIGTIQIYGPGDIAATAIWDALVGAVSEGYYRKHGITVKDRWYALYIQIGGGQVGPDEGGWPVLVCTVNAAIDRKRGA